MWARTAKVSTAVASTAPAAATTTQLKPSSSVVEVPAATPVPNTAITTTVGPASTRPPAAPRLLPRETIIAHSTSSLASEPGCGGVCSYDAAKVLDNNPASAWAEGADGLGEGQSISFELDAVYSITSITISPGWQRSDNACLFLRNGRPSSVAVAIGANPPTVLRLDDAPTAQRFTLAGSGKSVRLTIETVQPGRACDGKPADADTLISEVLFEGYN
jgi:hypothetical protein